MSATSALASGKPVPSARKPYIGGQAVLEGVMMRAPGGLSVAVRRADGTIALREGPHRGLAGRMPLFRLVGLRGVASLVESLKLGFGALKFSADQQMTEEERASDTGSGAASMWLSTLFALALFIALPQGLAGGLGKLFGIHWGLTDASFHFVIGGFKLLIFLAYLLAIRRVPEIRRVFQYHGAEHKTIHAYEAELPLTVENVRIQSTLHPRCGTTFLVMVVVVSIVAGAIAAPLLLPNAAGVLGQVSILALRVALLPLIAALSFELQRLSARFFTRGPLRIFLWPGFLFQKITTAEPDDAQMEIAITALKAAEWRDLQADSVSADDQPLVFPSFEGFVDALPELRGAALPEST